MKLYPFIPLLCISLSACNNNKEPENVDGGPCSYKETILPAEIIRIDSNHQYYNPVFVVRYKEENAQDTFTYSSVNHQQDLYIDEAKKLNLKVGDRYQYVIADMVSGACNPHIVSIRWKKADR